jgi:hypothetical protein
MIRVSDYSTETGLRVRITCDTTDTTIQMPADEWEQLATEIKAGVHNGIAKEPKIPFIY